MHVCLSGQNETKMIQKNSISQLTLPQLKTLIEQLEDGMRADSGVPMNKKLQLQSLLGKAIDHYQHLMFGKIIA